MPCARWQSRGFDAPCGHQHDPHPACRHIFLHPSVPKILLRRPAPRRALQAKSRMPLPGSAMSYGSLARGLRPCRRAPWCSASSAPHRTACARGRRGAAALGPALGHCGPFPPPRPSQDRMHSRRAGGRVCARMRQGRQNMLGLSADRKAAFGRAFRSGRGVKTCLAFQLGIWPWT